MTLNQVNVLEMKGRFANKLVIAEKFVEFVGQEGVPLELLVENLLQGLQELLNQFWEEFPSQGAEDFSRQLCEAAFKEIQSAKIRKNWPKVAAELQKGPIAVLEGAVILLQMIWEEKSRRRPT